LFILRIGRWEARTILLLLNDYLDVLELPVSAARNFRLAALPKHTPRSDPILAHNPDFSLFIGDVA